MLKLRYEVLNGQLRLICHQGITAVDFQEVCAEIVVIILGEAQAELGHTTQIYVLEVDWIERLRIPVGYDAIRKGQYLSFAGSHFEVCELQRGITFEGASVNIHQ